MTTTPHGITRNNTPTDLVYLTNKSHKHCWNHVFHVAFWLWEIQPDSCQHKILYSQQL